MNRALSPSVLRRTWLITGCLLLSALGLAACSTRPQAAPNPKPAVTAPVRPPVVRTVTPPAATGPRMGRIDGLDYPGLNIAQPLTGWESLQGGVKMIVFSGAGEAYDARGNYYGMAEICSRTAVDEPVRRRDLEHCYFDRRDRHTYSPIGQQGLLTLFTRDDGQRFSFDMRDGQLARSE